MVRELTKQQLYLNGQWTAETGQDYQESINPATSEVVGKYAIATVRQVDKAVQHANDAFKTWRRTPAPERAAFLWKAAELFEQKREYIAEVMTREMGKVLTETFGEVNVVIETCRYMAGEGRRMYGETISSGSNNRTITMIREPLGVVACITPWNFPIALAAYKICAALISGNTIVWKPASEVALSAGIFTQVLHESGLPKGVLNLITGSGGQVGMCLAEHEDVKIISFTGSTEVGLLLSQAAAKQLKRISLELGGKNAAIVLRDAELDYAAECIVKGAFGTTGQKCTATSRVIVERSVKDALLKRVVELTKSLKIGNGLDDGVDIGPLVNEKQLNVVESYIKKALDEGAILECGGKRADNLKGNFFEPTIFSQVRRDQSIAKEEIFGPVLAFIEVDDYEEAIEVNNDTKYGLSTSIFTKSLSSANRAVTDIVSGLVYVNNGTANAEMGVAFGGMKFSGNGHREVSHHALDSMTEWKSVYMNYQ